MLGPGTVLGAKYRLEDEIGRGGMGSVWRATRLDLGTELAVKVMVGEALNKPGGLDRFTREAKAAASLSSPHVVRIIDFGIDAAGGVAFMAMELLEGESLASRLASGARQAPSVVARVITQVARALGQAHAAGIVHRDLKPANIFLVRNDDDELVKLLDFGIAKSRDGHSTATGSVLGTPYYMSPEQVNSLKDVDHRTDLWSLGVIACECLTGCRPFAAETLSELAMKIALGRAEVPSSLGPVPAGFDEWFARATRVDRALRFQSATELASALNAIAARDSGIAEAARTPSLGFAPTVVSAAPAVPETRDSGVDAASSPRVMATVASIAESGHAALSTTSGGGAAVPSEPRPNAAGKRWRRPLAGLAALMLALLGAQSAGLFRSAATPTVSAAVPAAPSPAAPSPAAPSPAAPSPAAPSPAAPTAMAPHAAAAVAPPAAATPALDVADTAARRAVEATAAPAVADVPDRAEQGKGAATAKRPSARTAAKTKGAAAATRSAGKGADSAADALDAYDLQ